MSISNQRGNVLLFTIIGIAMAAAIGMGMFYMTSTSSLGQAVGSGINRAYYLALAGRDYAIANWNIRTQLNGEFIVSNTERFSLSITDVQITSTGIVNKDTPFEARKTINAAPPSPVGGFSFAGGGITAMTTYTGSSGTPGSTGPTGVYVDTTPSNPQITLGWGSGLGAGTAGCVWYQGVANSNGSACSAGKCNFNKGIRAYFDFQYNTPWQGAGFTFAIVSGHNTGTDIAPVYINDYTDCGGGLSEYMAYAGPGVSPPGKGLQPPKIAVEFDPFLDLVPPLIPPDANVYPCVSYPNDVCACYPNLCSDNLDWCTQYSRNDNTFWLLAPPSLNNPIFLGKHSTFVYWGDNQNYCSPSSNTYDDNRHGNGGTTDPKNPDGSDINSDGTTYPYMIQDFDSFGTVIASPVGRRLSFRLEIDRVDDTTSVDYRKYKMRVWLKPYAVYTDSNSVTFDDTSKKFNQNNDYPPDFQQTITLTQTWHDIFDRILFGWTQATDSTNAQTVIIRNFTIDFKNKNDF